jgi:hypothetical protein
MHQIYDIEMANALAADRRAQLRRAGAGTSGRPRRARLRWRGPRRGPAGEA